MDTLPCLALYTAIGKEIFTKLKENAEKACVKTFFVIKSWAYDVFFRLYKIFCKYIYQEELRFVWFGRGISNII